MESIIYRNIGQFSCNMNSKKKWYYDPYTVKD